jgi:hypothetical protein
MAISVQPGSIEFAVLERPTVKCPAVVGNLMTFSSTRLGAQGQCTLTGAAGDTPRGYTLGLIQLQSIETNWGYYRGKSNADGSLLIQRAHPPARTTRVCRDTYKPGPVLADNLPGLDKTIAAADAALPLRMTAQLRDKPRDDYALTRANSLTGQQNFLQEVQIEFHFCAILTLLDPHGKYHHLKHFSWNLHWQATFSPSDFATLSAPWIITPNRNPRANSAHVSAVSTGGPLDHRFTNVITAEGAPNCNAVATRAWAHPIVRESPTWTNFNVKP